MAYVGYRPVLPGQNSNDWTHNVTGEVGVYSSWQKQSSVHLLEDMPLEDHVPGTGRHPHGILYSQMFTGAHQYLPMEFPTHLHGGQSVPYMRHAIKEFHGIESAAAFPDGYGHDGTREFTYSRFFNYGQLRVPSGFAMDNGYPPRPYGTAIANMGPYEPKLFQGVGDQALNDSGLDEDLYGHERVKEHFGVPSSKAL